MHDPANNLSTAGTPGIGYSNFYTGGVLTTSSSARRWISTTLLVEGGRRLLDSPATAQREVIWGSDHEVVPKWLFPRHACLSAATASGQGLPSQGLLVILTVTMSRKRSRRPRTRERSHARIRLGAPRPSGRSAGNPCVWLGPVREPVPPCAPLTASLPPTLRACLPAPLPARWTHLLS
jgi:hypothetical protein